MSESPKPEAPRSTALARMLRSVNVRELTGASVAPALAIIQRATRLASTLDWENAEPLEGENDV